MINERDIRVMVQSGSTDVWVELWVKDTFVAIFRINRDLVQKVDKSEGFDLYAHGQAVAFSVRDGCTVVFRDCKKEVVR